MRYRLRGKYKMSHTAFGVYATIDTFDDALVRAARWLEDSSIQPALICVAIYEERPGSVHGYSDAQLQAAGELLATVSREC